MNEFTTIEEAQLTATQWLWIYNNERPSMALGGITPAMKLAEAFKLKLSTLYCKLPLKMGGLPLVCFGFRANSFAAKLLCFMSIGKIGKNVMTILYSTIS